LASEVDCKFGIVTDYLCVNIKIPFATIQSIYFIITLYYLHKNLDPASPYPKKGGQAIGTEPAKINMAIFVRASTVFLKVFVFVGIDHLAKQEIVDVEKDEAGPSSSSRTSGLPTKPKGLFPTTKKIKSFAEYKKGKEKQWKNLCHQKILMKTNFKSLSRKNVMCASTLVC
jgi:hypothetical protein